MVTQQLIDSKAQKAFSKVKSDVQALRKENALLKEQIQNYDPSAVAQLKREVSLLRDKQESEVEKLKEQISKCTCSQNAADINDLRRDISKISFSSVKEDVMRLKHDQQQLTRDVKQLKESVDKVLMSDSISQRLSDVENDFEERLDTIERKLFQQSGNNSKKQDVVEDDVIEKFASSYEEDDKSKKSFGKWLFSKEVDTDDVDEVK